MKGSLIGIGVAALVFTGLLSYLVGWEPLKGDLWNCLAAFILLYASMFLGVLWGQWRE